MRIRSVDLRAISRLWRELSEFPAAEIDQALIHYLDSAARLIGAENAGWIGAVRREAGPTDEMNGWRPRAVHLLHPSPARDRVIAELLDYMSRDIVDPHVKAIVAGAGTTRACLRRELIDDETWRRSWLYNDFLRVVDVEDRLVGAHAVAGTAESYVYLDRGPRDPAFGERERDLLHLLLAGAPDFHRETMAARGLLTILARLSPREREVLRLLLTDLTEKEIAERLGLTARTTHQYVVSVLRKIGVRGRVGLMARWLRWSRGGGAAPDHTTEE